MSTLQFDDGLSRRIEATYTTPDVVEQRRTTLRSSTCDRARTSSTSGRGQASWPPRWPGVGPDGTVPASIPARACWRSAGAAPRRGRCGGPVHRRRGHLPAFPDASFDVVTSTQVYEYVADMPAALAEAHRVVRPGGRLLVLDTDWDSIVWRSTDPTACGGSWPRGTSTSPIPTSRRLTGLLRTPDSP